MPEAGTECKSKGTILIVIAKYIFGVTLILIFITFVLLQLLQASYGGLITI